ncbi:Clp protease N-terminal domain-containing protein, partial [Staphylococcus pseudintermedius]
MDINQMTHAIQNALQKAIEHAKTYKLTNVEVEAVLKAVLEAPESLFQSILERANIDTHALNQAYEDKLKNYPTVKGDNVQYGQY